MSKLRLIYIPDVQVRENVPTDHILAAGRYIVKHRPDVIVVGGDWWDMPSCSMFNTKKSWEGLRIKADLEVGHAAMELFLSPLHELQSHQRKNKKRVYNPRMIFTVGNHDPQVRIPRLYEKYPELEGMFTIPDMTNYGFEEIPFMDIVTIEGINFSHFFVNPHSAKKGPLGGAIDTMLKNAGFSFVQGHQQGLKMGKHYLANGTCKLGIVAGSFYQHDEEYMGVQGNKHWRGIIALNEVEDGAADICEISLDYLRRKYL